MADDSGFEVGGDSSVMWTVRTANVRRGSIENKRQSDNGYLQTGINETAFDTPFTIGIKVPREDGKALAEALRAAAEDAERHAGEPGYRVTFPLVIEPKNVDQITITWASLPTAGRPPHHGPLGELVETVRKVVRKVAGGGRRAKPAKGAKSPARAAKTAPKKVAKKAAGKKTAKKRG